MATSRKKLWNLQQGATSNSKGSDQVETISVGHYEAFWSLDRLQKLKVFLRASQVKQMTSSMVLEVTRLRLYVEAYTGKDKHKGRHPFKKESSEYKKRQQRCPITKGTIMDKENNSGNYDARKEDNSRQVRHNQEDQKKQHQRTRDSPSVEKGR